MHLNASYLSKNCFYVNTYTLKMSDMLTPPDGFDPPIGGYLPAYVTYGTRVEHEHMAGGYYGCGYSL